MRINGSPELPADHPAVLAWRAAIDAGIAFEQDHDGEVFRPEDIAAMPEPDVVPLFRCGDLD